MQVALADGQSKIVGILVLHEIGGYENKKYHFLSFVKGSAYWHPLGGWQ